MGSFRLKFRNLLTKISVVAESSNPAAAEILVTQTGRARWFIRSGAAVLRTFRNPWVKRAIVALAGAGVLAATVWGVSVLFGAIFGGDDPRPTVEKVLRDLGYDPNAPASSLSDDDIRLIAAKLGAEYGLTPEEVTEIIGVIMNEREDESATVGSAYGTAATAAGVARAGGDIAGSLEDYARQINALADAAMIVSEDTGVPASKMPTLIAALRRLMDASPLVLDQALGTMTRNDYARRRRF